MSRTLTPADFVTLPNLTALEAHTLAQALVAVALAKDAHGKPVHKLNDVVKAAIDEIVDAMKALVAVAHLPAAEPVVRQVDIRIDRILSAMHQILGGWEKLEEELALGETAAALQGQLFAEGLQFTQIAPREEWAAIEQRLTAIKRDGLEQKLDSLGLLPVLKLLREVHVEYGKVTGATGETARENAQVRVLRLALLQTMREYVMAVMGSVIRKKPETQALADALLAPLAQWTPRPAQRRAEKGGEPAPAVVKSPA